MKHNPFGPILEISPFLPHMVALSLLLAIVGIFTPLHALVILAPIWAPYALLFVSFALALFVGVLAGTVLGVMDVLMRRKGGDK